MDWPILREDNKIAVFPEGLGICGVPLVGSADYKHSEAGLVSHVHEGCLEIVCLYRGRQIYWMNGREYCIYGGMVFAAPPDCLHSTGGHPEDKADFQWIQVDVSHSPQLLGLTEKETQLMRQQLLRLPPVFSGSPGLRRHLDAFFHAAQSGESLSLVRMKTELTAFLLEILDCGSAMEEKRELSGDIQTSLMLIEQELGAPADWEGIARAVHLSDSRFRQKFKEQLGVPPQEYLWRRRVDAARELVAETEDPFTQISRKLGFETASYFTRVFKRYTGMTPTQCREERRKP